MITFEEAQARVLALATPLPSELVSLRRASGRVLQESLVAARNQPPFAASAMDGYAVVEADWAPGTSLTVIGEAAAGHGFDGTLEPGQSVRIFTGAPLPEGADRVVIQEDVSRDGTVITLGTKLDQGRHVRPAGADFKTGDQFAAPKRLTGTDLALLAAMNVPQVAVAKRPSVALLATGDELIMPGEHPQEDQIIASNIFGLAAMVEAEGGEARILPIAADTEASLGQALKLARGADVLVTIGGASVGDHDLVGQVAAAHGLHRAFYKIAMRPGKPLMAGHLGAQILLGLPGNPVSALVCGELFLRPLLRRLQGLEDVLPKFHWAHLSAPLPANGPRAHFMRGRVSEHGVEAFERQDSALLTVMAEANCLVYRPIKDPARQTGEKVSYLPLVY